MQLEPRPEDNVEIELPLVKVTEKEVYETLLVNTPFSESFKDGVLKLETWIMNFAEEQVAPLRDSAQFTENEIDAIKKKVCVISPITLTLYTHWLQMESFLRLPDSEKEKFLLGKMPNRFKARFKGNASNRQAREITADEEAAKDKGAQNDSADEMKRRQGLSLMEFLKEFGNLIKEELKSNEGKAA